MDGQLDALVIYDVYDANGTDIDLQDGEGVRMWTLWAT